MVSHIRTCLMFLVPVLFALVVIGAPSCNSGDDDDDDRGESYIEGGGASPEGGDDDSDDDAADDDDDDDDDDDCGNNCYDTEECIEMAAYTYACGIVFELDDQELTLEEVQMMCAQEYNASLGCAVYCWQDSLDADCAEYDECLATNCA